MEVEFESEVPAALDFIPLTVSVDGKDLVANEDPVNEGYYTYTPYGSRLAGPGKGIALSLVYAGLL